MTDPIAVPLTMTDAGPQPTPPATLRQAVLQSVAAANPGYTANLPGTLIEDILSTEMGALVTMDQARTDSINNASIYSASPYVLTMLGTQAGIALGQASNASAYVVFSGPAGYVIPPGFVVSDGTYQYVLQSGGIIGSSGSTNPLYVVATQGGSWAILANSITTISTSISSGYTITVTNPEAGVPGAAAESVQSYRSRTLDANQTMAQGAPSMIRTALQKIPGVVPRLISVYPTRGTFEVICGGGDPYLVANAIYSSFIGFSTLVGSVDTARNIYVGILDYPNIYKITYVNPVQQIVAMSILWNTNLQNFTASSQVNQLGSSAIQNYVNGIYVGEPINLLEAQTIFQDAVSGIINANNLTALVFTVSINGSIVSPSAGTMIISGDYEGYFYSSPSDIVVAQG